MDKQAVAQWALSSSENAVSYATQHNPTGVYNWIKKNYGTQYPSYAIGYEKNDVSKQKMFEFLVAKARGTSDEQTYIANFLNQVRSTGAATFQK